MTQEQLTDKQERFCQEYLIDLNATQAALRAGYSADSAKSIGHENLTKPDIGKRIAELNQERLERTQTDAGHVLKRLVEIDKMDIADVLDDSGTVLPIKDWPAIWRTTLAPRS